MKLLGRHNLAQNDRGYIVGAQVQPSRIAPEHYDVQLYTGHDMYLLASFVSSALVEQLLLFWEREGKRFPLPRQLAPPTEAPQD